MIMRRKREPYLNNKRKTIDVLCDCALIYGGELWIK